MRPEEFPCDRIGCEALPGEPCKPIPRYDGQRGGDPELAVATVHQNRLAVAAVHRNRLRNAHNMRARMVGARGESWFIDSDYTPERWLIEERAERRGPDGKPTGLTYFTGRLEVYTLRAFMLPYGPPASDLPPAYFFSAGIMDLAYVFSHHQDHP
jgi:hypothetical protein